MSNGTRTSQTTTTTTTTVNYVYTGLTPDTTVEVLVADGMMNVTSNASGIPFSAMLPLAAAPIMVQIAADMVAELATQTAAATTAPAAS